jgi:hypothetical protein
VVDAADPAITVQPATESNGYAKTDTISLSVTAEITDGDSGGVLSYQWFSNALNNTSTGTELAEAVTGSLSIPAYSFIGDRYYYVKVTNTNETVNGVKTKTVTSNVVLVKVNPSVADARLKLLYKDFIPSAGDAAKILDESGNGFTGALEGSAAADTSAKVMTTGSGSGYLDMGAAAGAMVGNLEDYTISTYIYVGAENALNSWGNFVWLFAGADSLAEAKGGIYFDAHRTRAAIQQVGATMESAVTTKDDDTNKQAIEKGIWKHFTYRQSGNTGNLYMDGKLIVTAPVTVKPKDYTNPLTVNVLGKPGYGGDSYLNYAKYRDFRIYNAPLEAGEILALAGELDTLNTSEATQIKNSVDTYVGTLSDGASPAGNLTAVAGNLALPIFVYNSNGHIAISWATSDPAVITTTGVVTRPPNGESDATLTLTASFTKGSYTATKVFNVTVKAAPPDLNQYLKLRYEVNAAGNGFENVAPTDGNTYTPQHYLGSFETVNGLKVYNTGGTVDNAKGKTEGGADTPEGQGDLCPWAAGYYWDHYENIGYVDLGAQSGELLRTLGEFSIETYLYLPANAQTDRVGQYVWAFADQVAPANAVWFNYREFTFVIKIAEEDTAVGSDWNNASPKHGKGAWHHLLVTKNSSTAAVYLDGEQVLTGASTVLTTAFTAGTLDTNYLGKPCYAPGVWDQGLFDTKFHSFSIFNKAMTADEAAYLTSSGPLATLRN